MKHCKFTPGLAIRLVIFFSLFLAIRGQAEQMQIATHLFTVKNGIKSPLRIALDSDGTVYVSDYEQKFICWYDADGNLAGYISADFVPLSIAVANGHLFVGDAHSGTIKVMDTAGTELSSFGDFEQPTDAVIDDENHLYVVDSKLKKVFVFDLNGNAIGSFGEDIFIYPTGIAFDRKNQRLLVAEHGGVAAAEGLDPIAKIHVFNKQGKWLTSYGQYGSDDGQFARIQGLAVDHLGRIFACDPFQGTVTVLDENRTFLGAVGQYGSEPGQLRLPMDVVIDAKNRLWIASLNNSSLEIFDTQNIPTDLAKNAEPELPLTNQLLENYPNPFNRGTLIPFIVAQNGPVLINIYNLTGQKIRTFDLGNLQRGHYLSAGKAVQWDGTDGKGNMVASGLYFYELRSGNFSIVRRMLFLK